MKTQNYSIEAEQAVIGGILLDQTAWDRISDLVSHTDFYNAEHRIIFKAIYSLSNQNKSIDYLTLNEELKINHPSYSFYDSYLLELANNTPSVSNIVAYAGIVRERSIFRQIISASGNISNLAFNPEGRDAKDVLDSSEKTILKIRDRLDTRQETTESINDLLKAANAKLEKLKNSKGLIAGLTTGFKDLDKLTCGLNPSDLIIVAGRPSMGKTSFAMNIVEHIARVEKKPTLVFSMEMSNEQLTMRLLSSNGWIDQRKLRTGNLSKDDCEMLKNSTDVLSKAPIYIDNSTALTPSDLRAKARRFKRKHGSIGLIMVDYLQLMQVHGFKENRTNEISTISRSLKSLAKEMNVPVIALSQLNRNLEQRQDKRPVMSDLRDSGAIEQDSDVIIFIYRDEVYNEQTLDKGVAEIIVSKQRNGETGTIRLNFVGSCTRFHDYMPRATIEARLG